MSAVCLDRGVSDAFYSVASFSAVVGAHTANRFVLPPDSTLRRGGSRAGKTAGRAADARGDVSCWIHAGKRTTELAIKAAGVSVFVCLS